MLRRRWMLTSRPLQRTLWRYARQLLAGTTLGSVALTLLAFNNARAQSNTVVRGRVTTRQHKAIAQANVSLLDAAQHVLVSGTTDTNGRYSLLVTDVADQYTITVRQVGYLAFSRVVRRQGTAPVIDVDDIALAERVDILQPVVTRVAKLVPSRGNAQAVGTPPTNANSGADLLVDPSDVTSLAALLPGVQSRGDSGFSILGAGPSQNKVVVDGAEFSGGNLPRDAMQTTSLVTNPFDPAQGRFAGGEMVVNTRRGTPEFESVLRGQLTHPRLAWADPNAATGVPILGSVSGYASGELRSNLDYFAAVDAAHRSLEATSLLSPRPGALSSLGISTDTIERIARALTNLGLPASNDGVPSRTSLFQGSATTRLDLRAGSNTSLTLSVVDNWSRTPRSQVAPLAFPSTANDLSANAIRVLVSGGSYVGRVLDEVHLAASTSSIQSGPVTGLPRGTVRLGTSFDDGRAGMSVFQFGGTGSAAGTTTSHLLSASNDISWVTTGGRHQLKATQELRREDRAVNDASNLFGQYEFYDTDALLANQPMSYQRTLAALTQRAHTTSLALSLGDYWNAINGRLALQGGVRLDATQFGVTVPSNQVVASQFDLHTDRVPRDVGLSPRLGFSWRFGPPKPVPLIPPGTTTLDASSARGFRAPLSASGIAVPPDGDLTLTGGVGAFRGVIPLADVAGLTTMTGLPASSRVLRCVGDATPLPDWQPDGAPPTQCVNGADGVFATTDPTVTVFSSHFRAPLAWRGSLGLEGWRVHGVAIAPEVTLAWGRNVASRINRNLTTSPAFSLAGEGNRPVYAAEHAIDPATGLFGPGAGRASSDLGTVTEIVSDLAYQSAQFTFAVLPIRPVVGEATIYGVYAFTPLRVQQRGFDGTTAGDPRAREWVNGNQSRHQFVVGTTNLGIGWLRLGTRFSLRSGAYFTPVVAQDVNGDGRANDRAYIPNLALASDGDLATQVRTLLATARPETRRCLERQAGGFAAADSCQSGWSLRMDLDLRATPSGGWNFGERWRAAATIVNAGSALVRLLHLTDSPLGRPSDDAPADPRLFFVDGFDTATHTFRYRVNEQFGRPFDNGRGSGFPPFELQLGVQYQFGRSAALARMPARPKGSASTRSADSVAAIAALRATLIRAFIGPNPVDDILNLRDTLTLTDEQVQALQGVAAAYDVQRDSLLAPVVQFAHAAGARLTQAAVQARMNGVQPAIHDLGVATRQRALSFLTLEQRQALALRRP